MLTLRTYVRSIREINSNKSFKNGGESIIS